MTNETIAVGRSLIQTDERSRFKFMFGETGLSNDRLKSADSKFVVIRNWNGDRALTLFLLHNDVTSTPAYFDKPMFR